MKQSICFFLVGFLLGALFGVLLTRMIQKEKTVTITKTTPVEKIIEKHDTILVNKKARTIVDTFLIHGEQIVKEYHDTIVDTFFVPIETKQYTETKTNKKGTFVVDIEYRGAYASINRVDLQTNIKKPRWSIGVQTGLGASYDIINKNIAVGPYIGVGVCFSLFSF